MTDSDTRIHVAIFALPGATASTVYGMYDLFASSGRDWEFLVDGEPGPSPFEPVTVSTDGRRFQAGNGVWIEPDYALDDSPAPDVICIPELLVDPNEDPRGRFESETAWLRRHYAAGATLATACSGALLVAEAGLLDGADATTHWGYVESLRSRYPTIRMHPNRALVVSGEAQRIVMAGGGTSWMDVALFLIARFAGVEAAMRVARVNLIDWHDIGQQPFAALTLARQVDDAVIAGCQAWVAEHYDQDSPVAAMVERSGLAERTFKRRFANATGLSPMAYVHTLRLEEAKQMLEGSDLPVEGVANEVGYEDTSFFGRLFRRKVGLTPAQYRRRFGSLRQALQSTGH
ncbi:MAG: helix-turn-helix domain-containing protein [Gammaproteobacteria bacterium]|nr:helix-turn-helix domain-containing protein [Gammaproteobacteria bacterium]